MDSTVSATGTRHQRAHRKETDPWGIDPGYEDGTGKWHPISAETRRHIRRAIGAERKAKPPEPNLKIIRQGETPPLDREAELTLEGGTVLRVATTLPPDVPLGYHKLRPMRSRSTFTRLIVTPSKCYFAEDSKVWGWALQLYSLRSRESWGIGDFSDLRAFCRWAVEKHHAGIIMTNPLNASAPGLPQEASPYSPTSRIYRNPLYLRIEEIGGAHEHLSNLESLARRGAGLNRQPLIDRNAIYQLKLEALNELWPHVREQVDFRGYEEREGAQLDLFATYCAIAESYGANWREWPQEYRSPTGSGIRQDANEHADRVRFHKWIQFLLDQQLARACTPPVIMQDLPIGVDPCGADAWAWQDIFASGVSVGAPPDAFNTQGQDWGLQPFVPHKLRSVEYEPFARILRAAMRYSTALRIDHVMGLFRLFWIPLGAERKNGAYVRYRAHELLAILALESARAGAFVVGEDLGTVEEGVREKLAERGVLSYKVMWFEKDRPATYPQRALAAVTTHDLPTIAGLWTGADLQEQRQRGLKPNVEGTEETREILKRVSNSDEGTALPDVILRAQEALAGAPSAVVIASMEDALHVERRPNLPGTLCDERPNWSMPLPKSLEEIERDEFVARLAGVMDAGRTASSKEPGRAATIADTTAHGLS
jgi:4-alpha-glucanotransferase